MQDDRLQPRGELSLRTVAMPADTNPTGDIFGGWIMSLMDLAAVFPPAHTPKAGS
jgi:acyl-CoA thioesterase YciA